MLTIYPASEKILDKIYSKHKVLWNEVLEVFSNKNLIIKIIKDNYGQIKLKKINKLPFFKSVEEESDYFDNHSLNEFETIEVTEEFYKEIEKEKKKKITLWLDQNTISALKNKAEKYGVSYQKFTRTLLNTSLDRV